MADRVIARWGREFHLKPVIGKLPLIRFAHIARAGERASEMEQMDAMYILLESCFTAESWADFQECPEANELDDEGLLAVVQEAFEAIADRPTGRPSDSSDGSPTTNVNSSDDSSSPVIDRLVADGRPSVAYLIDQRRVKESRASA